MDSFVKIINIINYLDYRPKYEHNKCVKSISPKASCTICKDVCTYNAVTINKRSITIEESCKACNVCVSHCPTNALIDTGKKFIGYKEKVYLLCEEFKHIENIGGNLKIECLNFINKKILLNLYTKGYREIHTNLDKCSDCNSKSNIHKELVEANEVLSKLGKQPMSIINRDIESIKDDIQQIEVSKSKAQVDRRGFFSQLAKDFYSKTYEITPPSSRDQSWYSTSEIIELWNSGSDKKLSLFDIIIDDDKCIQCDACKKLCPQKVWDTSEDILKERFDLCNGCKLCEDICPTKALKVIEDIRIIERHTFEKETIECVVCNKKYSTFKPEINKCPSCVGKEVFNR